MKLTISVICAIVGMVLMPFTMTSLFILLLYLLILWFSVMSMMRAPKKYADTFSQKE